MQSFADYALTISFSEPKRRALARAEWLQRTAKRHAAVLGMTVEVTGEFPSAGLIVANHLSYADIVALAATAPCAFVAKREVASWPLFGAYARMGGTLFVDRERRGAVVDFVGQMREVIAEGRVLVLFPEGTSSDGAQVLPFRTSLFEPVLQLGCPITAVAFDYSLPGGSVAEEVCYWGEMTLLPHLLNLFSKPEFGAHIRISAPRIRTGDRKQVARELQAEVTSLRYLPESSRAA